MRSSSRLVGSTPTRTMATLGLGAALLVGCSRFDQQSPALVTPGTMNHVGNGVPFTEKDRVVSAGQMTVCLDKPGVVVIDRVSPVKPTGGFQVTAFGVRRNPAMKHQELLGETYKTLAEIGFPTGHRVTVACKKGTGQSEELGVQMTKTGPSHATSSGFLLHWHSASRKGQLLVTDAYVLCDAPNADIPACDTSRLLDN